jgi:non-canonical (house-cleaning) NTP pyrophosphatase
MLRGKYDHDPGMASHDLPLLVSCCAGAISTARSAEFLLPRQLSELVLQQGMELGAADDLLFGRMGSGRGSGTVGHLTHNTVTRAAYYEQVIVMALIPFINPELYPEFFL